MAASSVSSDIAAVFALLLVSVLVLLVLRQYLPLRLTPAYLLIPVFLALALPSSIVLLVPIDLASSSGTDTEGGRGLWLPEGVMMVAWRIAYWLTFALTWYVSSFSRLSAVLTYLVVKDRAATARRLHGLWLPRTKGSDEILAEK